MPDDSIRIPRSRLGNLKRLGGGGQGVVYLAPNVRTGHTSATAYKEYDATALATLDIDALEQMVAYLYSLSFADGMDIVQRTAWPLRLVVTDDSAVCGFLMPAVSDDFYLDMRLPSGPQRVLSEFQHLLNEDGVLASRGIPLTDRHRYELLLEVARTLSLFRRHDIAIGDISPKNLLFTLSGPRIFVIDCDAMRLNGRSATRQVETGDWEIKQVSGEEIATAESDAYKLGLLALRLFTQRQDGRDVNALPGHVPPAVAALVAASLSPEPAARPQPDDWKQPLHDAALNASTNVPRARSTPPSPTPTGPTPPAPTPVPQLGQQPAAGRAAPPVAPGARRGRRVAGLAAACMALVLVAMNVLTGPSNVQDGQDGVTAGGDGSTAGGTPAAANAGEAAVTDDSAAGVTDTSDMEIERGPVVVGSTDFSEQELVAEMYALVLEDAGYAVDRRYQLGSREVVFPAILNGDIDLTPEYLGTVLEFINGGAGEATSDTNETLRAARARLPQGLALLEPSPAQDQNALVVTRQAADRLALTTVSDLQGDSHSMVIGGPAECPQRPLCLPGYEATYGLDFANFAILDAGGPLTTAALNDGTVDVALMFSTQGAILEEDLVVLDDDRGLQPVENLTPLIREDVRNDEIEVLLDNVSDKLSTDILRRLNRQIERGDAPTEVAQDFVTRRDLVSNDR